MRRWLLDLHLYLGLLCLPYAVVLGVSAILMNHGLVRGTSTEWRTRVAPLAAGVPAEQAAGAWRALELRGKLLRPTAKRNAAGELVFLAHRPGRSYQVAVSDGGEARVVERNFGVLGVVRDLHGLSDPRSSPWSLGWALYTELTAATLLFSIVSGPLLLMRRPGQRALELGAGALGVVALGALLAAIW